VSHSSNPNARSYTLPISKASSSSASLFSFNCFKVSRIAFLCASNCAFVGPDVPPVGCCFDAFVFRSVPSLFSFGGAIFVLIRNSISVCNRPLRRRVCIRLRNALAFFFCGSSWENSKSLHWYSRAICSPNSTRLGTAEYK